jgi:hypothetical protein
MNRAEELVCAIVRGDVRSWTLADEEEYVEQIAKVAHYHNIELILFDCINPSSVQNRWPPRLREILETHALAFSTLDLIREQELRRVLLRLDEFGIRPLLLKGVCLAYTVYRSPSLRPRADTDLLIREKDVQKVLTILKRLGYDGPQADVNSLTSYECLYRRVDAFGVGHFLDVHWKLNNAQLFANTFTFDELSAEAIDIPALAPCARGLGFSHALLLACMHRFGHAHAPFYVDGEESFAGDNLRWVYDIHLLSSIMNTAQWSDFVRSANAKDIAHFCLDGLEAAQDAFNTHVPTDSVCALAASASKIASSRRLRVSGTAWFIANVQAIPSLYKKIEFIKQTGFPSAALIMEKYGTSNRFMLPLLYAHRTIKGILKRIKRLRGRR